MAKLVAVVEGKEVLTAPWRIKDDKVGMWLAYLATASAPRPSTKKSSSRPTGLGPH